MVDAPAASHGADTLRLSPWTAEDLRAPLRPFMVADWVPYASQRDPWTLSGRWDDSWGAKDKGPRHREAVAYLHDHPKSHGQKKPYNPHGIVQVAVRFARGTRASADDGRLALREQTGRRPHHERAPAPRRRLRKNTTLAQERPAA
jgi:hypothetical protein